MYLKYHGSLNDTNLRMSSQHQQCFMSMLFSNDSRKCYILALSNSINQKQKNQNQLRVDQSSKIKCNFHMLLYFMFSIVRIKNVLCGYFIQIITQTLYYELIPL